MKVLVLKRDKLGDLLLTTPLLARLKEGLPQAETHLLANDYNSWVVAGNPHIDRLWVYRRVRHAGSISVSAAWQWLRQSLALRRERYDWVIIANGDESPRAIRRGLSLRGIRTVAHCVDASNYPGLSDPVAPDASGHEVERLLALLAPLGMPAPPAQGSRSAHFPRYVLPAASADFAREWLAERGLSQGGYVLLGLGARRPKKQPSTAQVLAWSAHVKAAWGLDTVFTWTPGKADDARYPGDDEVAQPVLDARAPQIHPFRGPIPQALGLIWSARTCLFPDSGLMHFAAASPGGVLGFFAESDVSPSPAQWAPRGPRAHYLEAEKSVAELPAELIYARLAKLLG
ncbi:MAG: glycosyltransferase family 9 protein [Candidatus Parcubacteria bacterium]|nr:glycosyltransferase family 9 protein [Burkholderiales bacterium]